MHFCNLRCFCVWWVKLATRSNLPEEVKTDTYSLITPSGEQHQFSGIVEVARWATAIAFDEQYIASEMASREKRSMGKTEGVCPLAPVLQGAAL